MTDDASVTQFNDDYTTLNNDITAYDKACTDEQEAQKEYDAQYQTLCAQMASGADPTTVLLGFFSLICQQGLTMMDIGIEVDASIMTVQGDMTNCGSDIENMYNDGSTATMDQIAGSEDKMLDLTCSTPATQEGQDLQKAIGTTTSSELYGYMLDQRQDIYIYNKTDANPDGGKYNPTVVSPAPASGETRSYHFSDDGDTLGSNGTIVTGTGGGAGYMGSIALLTQSMSQSGDPYQATEAKQRQTDDSNEWNATLNSASSATQEIMQNLSNEEQSWISFDEDLGQSLLKVNSGSVTDQIPS